MLTHDQVNANSITKITSWPKFMGKNLRLVGCATVCAKSEVMLIMVYIPILIVIFTISNQKSILLANWITEFLNSGNIVPLAYRNQGFKGGESTTKPSCRLISNYHQSTGLLNPLKPRVCLIKNKTTNVIKNSWLKKTTFICCL